MLHEKPSSDEIHFVLHLYGLMMTLTTHSPLELTLSVLNATLSHGRLEEAGAILRSTYRAHAQHLPYEFEVNMMDLLNTHLKSEEYG